MEQGLERLLEGDKKFYCPCPGKCGHAHDNPCNQIVSELLMHWWRLHLLLMRFLAMLGPDRSGLRGNDHHVLSARLHLQNVHPVQR